MFETVTNGRLRSKYFQYKSPAYILHEELICQFFVTGHDATLAGQARRFQNLEGRGRSDRETFWNLTTRVRRISNLTGRVGSL